MKKDKLQEFADKSLSKYDNPELREQLVRESVSGNVAVIDNRKRNWLIGVITVMIIAVLAFGTYLFWPKTPREKHYLLENQKNSDITVAAINAEIDVLSVSNQSVISSLQFEDTVYNEILYYQITFLNDETGEQMDIILVTNSDYNYIFNHNEYDKQNDTLNMSYTELFTEEDGIYTFDCQGEFAIDNIKIYVLYNGLSLESQSNFINFLQQCIEIKKGAAI